MLGKTGAKIAERRIFRDEPTVEEVRALAAKLPGGVRDLLSIRGTRYREMELAGRELSEEEIVQLLIVEPRLWRRPVVVREDQAVVGVKDLTALLS